MPINIQSTKSNRKDAKSTIKVLIFASIISALIFGFVGGILAVKFYPKIADVFPEFFSETSSSPSNKQKIKEKITASKEEAIINVVKNVSSSVVSVVLTKNVPIFKKYWETPWETPHELFPELQVPGYRQEGTETQKVGGGSGFIISTDGLILTNKHVVKEKDVDYTVILNDGEKYPAKVLARDPIQDLAVIKIEKKNLSPVKLGDSDNLQSGQTAITIGYSLGEFQNTVSVGVISGLDRNIVAEGEKIEGVIQTDAAINRGNSGGPLLNLSGEVIGINTAMAFGAENIGFAISINRVKRTIEEVKTKGKITYPFLGVSYLLINEELKQEYGLSVNYGALIIRDDNGISIIPGSGADKAGLQENDIILEINNAKITEENSLAKIILGYKSGDKIKLKILRQGEEKNIKAELGER